MKLISRTEALQFGLTRYFTGKPCAKGHVSERLTYNWMCAACNLEYVKKRYKKDPTKVIQRAIKYNLENPEKSKKSKKQWKLNNPNKVQQESARRRAVKLQRTPSWLNQTQQLEIDSIYRYCSALRKIGLDYEVDHIVPLRGQSVSGLHVPWNLQVLTGWQNGSKGNRL